MIIDLFRTNVSQWGVDGYISIRGWKVADTVEHPRHLLKPGEYPVDRRKTIIKRGNGPFTTTDGSVIVGTRVCNGCVIHSATAFDALYARIKKNIQRGKQVVLVVHGP